MAHIIVRNERTLEYQFYKYFQFDKVVLTKSRSQAAEMPKNVAETVAQHIKVLGAKEVEVVDG